MGSLFLQGLWCCTVTASAVAMSRLPLPEQDVYSGRDHLCMNGSEETKANFRRYAPGQFRSVWYCMPSFEDNVRALASRLDTRAIREKALVDKLYDYFVLRPAEHGDSGQDDNIWRTSGNEWIGKAFVLGRPFLFVFGLNKCF